MPKIPKPLRLLLLPALALSLAACATTDPNTPPQSRFMPVPLPTAPVGEARCDDDGDGELEPCLSQRQVDELWNYTIDVACANGDKLAWLLDFYHAIDLPPTCGGE